LQPVLDGSSGDLALGCSCVREWGCVALSGDDPL
jgi:hypothetical protein